MRELGEKRRVLTSAGSRSQSFVYFLAVTEKSVVVEGMSKRERK
jgi:hypothetical protein